MTASLTVCDMRKLWVTPSPKRTGVGAAATGCGDGTAITITSSPSVAAIANDTTVERMCLPQLAPGRNGYARTR